MEEKNKELHSIFKGIANKEEAEFNKLYNNYKELVYAIVFSMLKNKEDSDEIVQIVFTKIWNIKKENLPTNKETTWLYNVTKNETIDYLRKQKHTINIDDLYYIDEQNEELNDIIDKEYYNNIISKLNTKDQEIVSLKILSNLSFKEISQVLNIPMGTVQWKYYKSLHTLKILISNLTMFIVTFTIYLKQRTLIKEKANEEIINKNETEETQHEIEKNNTQTQDIEKDTSKLQSEITNKIGITKEPTKTEIDQNYASTQRAEDNTLEISNEEMDNILNETVENIIVDTENKNLKQQNTMYISGIFLIITIIFLVIYIKQKIHKLTK